MTAFISGGSKSGKSSFAESLACRWQDGPLYYIATMIPCDDEDYHRIQHHLRQRDGLGFVTLECPTAVHSLLDSTDRAHGTYLLDSVTALLLNEMYPIGSTTPDPAAATARVCRDLTALIRGARNVVFVSDYIYSDAQHYPAYTADYCRALAAVDRHLATLCGTVVEMMAHQPIYYKRENL